MIEGRIMQGNGEHQANDDAARAAGFASPFDRTEWFDLLAAHGFAGEGRIDASGRANGTAAWLPLRIEAPGALAGLTNWYSFAIRPLFSGGRDRRKYEILPGPWRSVRSWPGCVVFGPVL